MTKQKLAAFAVAMMAAALSGCGSTPPFEQNSTSPPSVAELRYGPNLLDPRLVGAARDDYLRVDGPALQRRRKLVRRTSKALRRLVQALEPAPDRRGTQHGRCVSGGSGKACGRHLQPLAPARTSAPVRDHHQLVLRIPIVENFEVAGGLQYGAATIHLADDRLVIGAFVDGGRLGPPTSSALNGTATWQGTAVGFDAVGHIEGAARLTANFTTQTGAATFNQWANWNGTTSRWTASTRHGTYRYTLDYDRHWFRSTDTDPDVVGAIYGHDGAVVGGTLERGGTNWVVAGFGAEKTIP